MLCLAYLKNIYWFCTFDSMSLSKHRYGWAVTSVASSPRNPFGQKVLGPYAKREPNRFWVFGLGSRPSFQNDTGPSKCRRGNLITLAQKPPEAMHNLGVPTTRALCLVTSRSDSALRAPGSNGSNFPEKNELTMALHGFGWFLISGSGII